MAEELVFSNVWAESDFIVKFAGEGWLSAEVVSESLAGWAGLYHRVPGILGEYHPAFKHLRLVPFLESIDRGSMYARILARLVTSSAQDAVAMENDIDAITDLAKQALLTNIARMNPSGKAVVYGVLGATVAYGALNISGFLKNKEHAAISNASGIVINNSAINIGVDPSLLTRMVDAATRDNARLTKQTLAALRPAGVLSEGDVQIGDDGTNLVITADAAKIIGRINPDDLKPRIETRRIQNTKIDIRAIDLDKKTSGWAAIFPEVSKNRVRLTIAEAVKITAPGQYMGDVDLDVAIDLDGNEKPKTAHLLRLAK